MGFLAAHTERLLIGSGIARGSLQEALADCLRPLESGGDRVVLIKRLEFELDVDLLADERQLARAWSGKITKALLGAMTSEPTAGTLVFADPPAYLGAALLDAEGRVIGVGSLWVSDSLEIGAAFPGNMFVPIDLLKPLLDDLLAMGRRRARARPWLGVYSEEIEGHVVVTRVLPESRTPDVQFHFATLSAELAGVFRSEHVGARRSQEFADSDRFETLRRLPVTSIKGSIGHCMGAASALSAVACSIALEQGFIPPTINHADPDPECGLDCVPNAARVMPLRVVQNNAFAFGGNNSVVLFGRYG